MLVRYHCSKSWLALNSYICMCAVILYHFHRWKQCWKYSFNSEPWWSISRQLWLSLLKMQTVYMYIWYVNGVHIRKMHIVTVSVWFKSKSFLNNIHWKLKNKKHSEVKCGVRNNAVSFLCYSCKVNLCSVDVVVTNRLLYTDKHFKIQHLLIWCQNLAKKISCSSAQIPSTDLRRWNWQPVCLEIASIKFIIFVNITTLKGVCSIRKKALRNHTW